MSDLRFRQIRYLLRRHKRLGDGRVEAPRHAAALSRLVLERDLDALDGERRSSARGGAGAASLVDGVELSQRLYEQGLAFALHL